MQHFQVPLPRAPAVTVALLPVAQMSSVPVQPFQTVWQGEFHAQHGPGIGTLLQGASPLCGNRKDTLAADPGAAISFSRGWGPGDVTVLVIGVATLLTADQPVPGDHGLRATHTTEELLARKGGWADVLP